MKIAFWSNFGNQIGLTSNLAAVGMMAALLSKHTMMLLPDMCSTHSVADGFSKTGDLNLIQEDCAYFYKSGMEDLLQKSKERNLNREEVKASSVCVYKEQVYYIKALDSYRRNDYKGNSILNLMEIVNIANDIVDMTLIDGGSGENEFAEEVLKQADLIVVNFNQNPNLMNRYFESRSKYSKKAIYLIGNYDYHSTYNARNIQRLYRLIPQELGLIPYNVRFQEAFSKGKTKEFIRNYYQCLPTDSNYYFIKELKRTTKIIMQAVGLEVQDL